MNEKEGGAPLNEAPEARTQSKTLNRLNTSTNVSVRKQSEGGLGKRNSAQTRQQLAQYLELGLTPIPLRGKIPLFPWKQWQPKSLDVLEPFIHMGCDWGIKTGNELVVLDFDTLEAYESFMAANRDKLPLNTPIVKTGRGFHFWFRTTKPVKTQHFEGLDIKGEDGYVCAPPSIHANGNQYTFIRALSQEIPTVDLENFVLPCVKPDYSARTTTTFNASEWKPIPGNMVDLINNGAEEGQRHNVLVSYLGALISRGYTKEWVSETAVLWNSERNQPPLPSEEVLSTIESCWASFKPRVPIKTLKDNSVLNGTGPEKRKSPEERRKIAADLMAKEKVPELPHNEMCGRRHAISRRNKTYMSVTFFCGSWNCPRCADYFRRRWLNRLQEVTCGSTLFITNIVSSDWPRFRRSLNRLSCEYVRIRDFGQSTVITNKPVPGSNPIPEGQFTERLEALIPHQFMISPVSTSRAWQLEKKVKDPEKEKATLVTRTFLPIDIQQAIAKQLGAKLDGERRWVSPEKEDAQEWEYKFTSELAKYEAHIWSETAKKKESLEGWVDDFNKVMEADDVFDRGRERWEVMAG